MSKQYDLLLRLLIIGDSGVGKTCLLCRYVDDQFYPNYAATIGIDFKVKNIFVDGKRIRLQIWDTAGQERFETITKQYYRRAQGIILVYDISNAATFRHIAKWMGFCKQYGKKNAEVTVVGNKTDLNEWRQVDSAEGEKLFEDLVYRIMLNQSEELRRQTVDSYPSDSDSDLEGTIALESDFHNRKGCSCVI